MKRLRKKQSTYASEEHDILGGRGKILRVKASGDVWQLRIWIADEGKYFRQSLKTRDFETAVKKAEEIILQKLSDVASGRKIFGVNLKELTDGYIKYREQDVVTNVITAGRLLTIKSQLKNFLKQKSSDLKLAELNRKSYFDYSTARKLDKNGTRDVTIRNEQATINHMMAWAWREGLCHFDKFEFRKLKIDEKEEVRRRDTFTLDEYDALIKFLRTYASEKVCSDKTERLERLLIKDAVLIASNTCMRMGELTNLKWGDIKRIEKTKDENGKEVHLVSISLRRETVKTRRSRLFTSRGGEYFLRLKERSKHTTASDYVFASINGTSKLNRQKWYLHWKNLMNGIGLDYKRRNVTWYSLRHFGITCRLRAEVSHLEIGNMAGTAIGNIQKFYGHIDTGMRRAAALKTFKINKDGIDVLD